MKKKILLLLMIWLPVITTSVFAQPMASMRVPYRQVIISEYFAGGSVDSYVELTNVGDSTVNLYDFYWWSCDQRSVAVGASNVKRDAEGNITNVYYPNNELNWRFWVRLPDHLLKPGESFVISPVFDATNPDGSLLQREEMCKVTDMTVHPAENPNDSTIYKYSYPEYYCYNFDSISSPGTATIVPNASAMRIMNYNRTMLRHRIYDTAGVVVDSILIDGVKLIFTETGGGELTNSSPSIAGIAAALDNNIIVRKADIKYGNLNWDLSAGVSAEDSEWQLIPKFTNRKIWSTVGVHGDFNVIAESEILDIYLIQQVIKVPWGVYKINNGDSIIPHMTPGPGMAWKYLENTGNFEGGGHTIVQEGDTLILYATGDELEVKNFRLIQNPPEANETRVFPMRILYMVDDTVPTWGGMPYYVTKYGTVMDTVGDIDFATRVDTVFKYLEKPEKATWEIIWVDGQPRVDLKKGDLLRVTAENGIDTKDYYLDVLPYALSSNAYLASITWPEKPGFLMDWAQDTIPKFAPMAQVYNVLIPNQTAGVPALQVTTQDLNAKVEMFPAVSLDGTYADRTTHIRVTAQDDSSMINYYVTFNREKPSAMVQPWQAEPIISEIVWRTPTNGDGYVELYNPGTEPIDLSNYLYAAGFLDPAPLIQGIIATINPNYRERYMNNTGYIPGFKWPATKELWDLNPGKVVIDPTTDPIIDPGEVFIMACGAGGPDNPATKQADVILGWIAATWGTTPHPWGEQDNLNSSGYSRLIQQFVFANKRTYIYKILNDSIQRGLKAITDPNDFELIEMFGYEPTAIWTIAGKSVNVNIPYTLIRKSNVYAPRTDIRGGFGTSAENSDWIPINLGETYEGVEYKTTASLYFNLGLHIADPVTFYRSTVFSHIYKVDDGYQGNLNIRGVSFGENVEAFLNNVIKADTGQTLVVSATEGGPAKGPAEAIAQNDILTVTSADSSNQTAYTISLIPLDDDNTLSLTVGSTLVISREGNAGIISGFAFGTNISTVFEQVVKPASAELRIINEQYELFPMTVMNNDTVKVPAVIDNQVYLMVKAENGDTALYHLQPSTLASDAYVLSDLYVVDQEASTISFVIDGTGVSNFYANLNPVAGATIQVRDKKGLVRNIGDVSFDDFLYVTSQDKSVTKVYFIQFIGEPEGLQTEIRTLCPDITNLIVSNVSQDGTEATLAWDYEFGLEFGFVILRDNVVIDTVITNTYINQGIVPGVVYQYSVYAYNEFGNSRIRSIWVGRTLCPDPSNLSLASLLPDGTGATLAWDYDFGLEYGFVIVRDGSVIDTILTNTFTDQGLEPGATYEYSVYAYNEFGNSGSQTIMVTTTGLDQLDAEGIIIYPNITTDMVYFRNLPEDSRVVLTDLAGRSILVKNAYDLSDGLSMQPYSNGYYLIRVIQGHEYLKSVKVLKM